MGKHRQEKLCSKILITVAAVLLLVGGYYYRIHKISVRLKAENPAAQL